jgi:queuine tRNA-ribosyltransferase
MKKFKFTLNKSDNNARAGLIQTSLGDIKTPAFMPVATQGAVKSTPINIIEEIDYDMILSNTYHILLRPGLETLKNFGNLSKFMNWNKPILTDSGGFQVMSLSKLRKIDKNGVTFQSHIDGSSHRLTPENVVDIQNIIGSNIQMVLDECTSFPSSFENANNSMELSLNWAERARKSFLNSEIRSDAQFGIIQGSTYEDLRIKSALETINIDFEGYAVGGLAVGEGHDEMIKVLKYTLPILPDDKVRYLMGVGRPENIIESISEGIDIFDCVIPTREGRHGHAYCKTGTLNLRNKIFENDKSPLDEESDFSISRRFSKGYIHHLIKSKEPLGGMIISWHNLNYYKKFMEDIRVAILENRFSDFKEEFYLSRGSNSLD